MRRTWRLIKRWVLPFLPGSSSFPFPGGLGSGTSLGGAGGTGAPSCCPGDPGRGRNRGRGSRQTCRPVFLCPTFLLFPLPPSECTGSPAGGGLQARESQSLDGEPENNRGKNGKLCQGLWGKNIDVSNKGPACVGERGLHVRPDCVAFTHGEEMSAWYWPKFILYVWRGT